MPPIVFTIALRVSTIVAEYQHSAQSATFVKQSALGVTAALATHVQVRINEKLE